MNGLKIIFMGILIWGISLVWPEINRAFTPLGMGVSTLGLIGGYVLYLKWKQRQPQASPGERKSSSAFKPPSTSSRPVKPVGLA